MKELWEKIKEALVSALPVTAIVYIMALTPLFTLSRTELITFTVGAVMLVLAMKKVHPIIIVCLSAALGILIGYLPI